MSSVQYPSNTIFTSKTSIWARRGWTFQEDLLSARQVIFTGEQVWWRCPCATWCEASQLESIDSVRFLLDGHSVVPRLRERYSDLATNKYAELVASYAQRTLSYPSDGLNAISGVLSMLTQYSGEEFLWGLMKSRFQSQLHWFGRATKRTLAQQRDLPTWSWVSWEGQTSFDHHLTYEPLMIYYSIKEDHEGQTCVRTCQSGDFSNEICEPARKAMSVVRIEDVENESFALHLKPDFHLLFYTCSATFHLTLQGRLTLPHLPVRYQHDARGTVVGPKPDYGYLIPSLEATELSETGNRECILLGRRPAKSVHDEVHVLVMLIARDAMSIAHRLGIADMPEEFWDLAEKTRGLIALG